MGTDQWLQRWRHGRIGFHQNQISARLAQFWPHLNLPRGSSVFVPLCGKSLDLLWLRDQQYDVVGLELSDIAVECFFTEHGVLARRSAHHGFNQYTASGLRVLQGDLFALRPEALERVDAVFDRASLIAMSAELRSRYVEKLVELTRAGAQTLLVTLEYPQQEMSGPPFSVDSLSVECLYSAHHKITELDRADILASDPLRSRGISHLHEVTYHLTRL